MEYLVATYYDKLVNSISSSSLCYTYGSQKKHQYIKLQGNMLLTLLG